MHLSYMILYDTIQTFIVHSNADNVNLINCTEPVTEKNNKKTKNKNYYNLGKKVPCDNL